jgi:hypothetical protein
MKSRSRLVNVVHFVTFWSVLFSYSYSSKHNFIFQLASDLHLQTHLRGTRHNQLLIERFNQKNENGIKKQPTQAEIVK